jgi:hypothetical protein
MKPINFSRLGGTLSIHRQWSARKLELQKRPAGHTAGLFSLKMNIGSAFKPGAILKLLSQKRVTEKDLQVTLQVFFLLTQYTRKIAT